jgi:hypothetical protein
MMSSRSRLTFWFLSLAVALGMARASTPPTPEQLQANLQRITMYAQRAAEAQKANDHATAIALYRQALEVGFVPALSITLAQSLAATGDTAGAITALNDYFRRAAPNESHRPQAQMMLFQYQNSRDFARMDRRLLYTQIVGAAAVLLAVALSLLARRRVAG